MSSGASGSSGTLAGAGGRTVSSSTVGGAEAALVAGAGGTRTSPEYQGGVVVFFSHMAMPALHVVVLLIRAIRAGHTVSQVDTTDMTSTS